MGNKRTLTFLLLLVVIAGCTEIPNQVQVGDMIEKSSSIAEETKSQVEQSLTSFEESHNESEFEYISFDDHISQREEERNDIRAECKNLTSVQCGRLWEEDKAKISKIYVVIPIEVLDISGGEYGYNIKGDIISSRPDVFDAHSDPPGYLWDKEYKEFRYDGGENEILENANKGDIIKVVSCGDKFDNWVFGFGYYPAVCNVIK